VKKITMDIKASVNEAYEFLQIINDFDNPLQIFREALQDSYDSLADTIICKVDIQKSVGREYLIIEVIDNGQGLERDKVKHFFDLANSTKIGDDFVRHGAMVGYKGHGDKIYFNSERVVIASKCMENEDSWAVICEKPLTQLAENKELRYSKFLDVGDIDIIFPDICINSGFYLRIVKPLSFESQNTWYKLKHLSIRDYIKWFTIFGSIKPLIEPNESYKTKKLYLRGLDFDEFQFEYNNDLNPEHGLKFINLENERYEVLDFGHYFPQDCFDIKQLNLKASIEGKDPLHYYSRRVSSIKNPIYCPNAVKFNLIIHLEGTETKRKYNLCLKSPKRRGNKLNYYTDETRYGIWACKDGIPIERVDDWLPGKGSYSYMHAFIDCDSFQLTANRGSIRNTDTEIIDAIKLKIKEILEEPEVSMELNHREKEQDKAKIQKKIRDDQKNLQRRFKRSKSRKKIVLPDGTVFFVPLKLSDGGYSESETMILLIQLLFKFPGLFTFDILDYNTHEGIDFVVLHNSVPKYIELKGSLKGSINHSYQVVTKFICYDISDEISNGSKISDIEENIAVFKVREKDAFRSNIEIFNGLPFTGYKIEPESVTLESMEVIALEGIITEVLGGEIITNGDEIIQGIISFGTG